MSDNLLVCSTAKIKLGAWKTHFNLCALSKHIIHVAIDWLSSTGGGVGCTVGGVGCTGGGCSGVYWWWGGVGWGVPCYLHHLQPLGVSVTSDPFLN